MRCVFLHGVKLLVYICHFPTSRRKPPFSRVSSSWLWLMAPLTQMSSFIMSKSAWQPEKWTLYSIFKGKVIVTLQFWSKWTEWHAECTARRGHLAARAEEQMQAVRAWLINPITKTSQRSFLLQRMGRCVRRHLLNEWGLLTDGVMIKSIGDR